MSRPYRHGFMIWPPVAPDPAHPFTQTDAAIKAGSLHADVFRAELYWPDIQPGSASDWNTTSMDSLKALVTSGRTTNPTMKVLPMLDGVPTWVTGRANAHYMTAQEGYSQYGRLACAQIVSYLGDCADFIELSNEPNTTGGSGTNIPSQHYGGMAAYATYWMNACLGPNKRPLVGALAMGSGGQYPVTWQTYFANTQAWALYWLQVLDQANAVTLNGSWRASCHPYPALGVVDSGRQPTDPLNATGDRTGDQAATTVFTRVNDLQSLVVTGRKIWITETGVSGRKIGEGLVSGQARFASLLDYGVMARQPQIEGLIWFPFNDADPLACEDFTKSDCDDGAFRQFGVVRNDDVTVKAAASTFSSCWT